ncbi:MAG: fibronectin type III domain-containing protein [Pyrinomonadaceae bacterium]|nr:fibronectin type III domain-containing protein [Pyrinomonadaceae bacterium]
MLSNNIKRIKHSNIIVLFAFIIFSTVFGANCGKRRPPQPPKVFTQSKYELTGNQRGNLVVLSLTENTNRNASRAPKQTLIYRLSESPSAPLFLSEDDFASRAVLIGTINVSESNALTSSNTSGSSGSDNRGKLIYNDQLSLVNSPTRLRYAIRIVDADGRRTAFSNFFLIEPSRQVARPPASLASTLVTDAVRLTWLPSADDKASNFIGYNVYRISPAAKDAKDATEIEKSKFVEPVLLTPAPISENSFSDGRFTFGEEYVYFVRSVSSGANGAATESLDSGVAKIIPLDKIAPSAPESITVAAAPNRLSLFFAANTEIDLAGYNVYRTTDDTITLERWQKLNDTLLTATTYQDLNVESGKRYFYYLRATDTAGNISVPSVIVSEVAP